MLFEDYRDDFRTLMREGVEEDVSQEILNYSQSFMIFEEVGLIDLEGVSDSQ